MTWLDLLEKLGSVGILSTAATLLVRYFIDKKFKSYEFELQNSAEKFKMELEFSLETHKKSLEEISYKSSKLHDKRSEIIPELYGIICDLDKSMNDLTNMWRLVSVENANEDSNELKRIEKAAKHFTEYQDFYTKNRIYFAKKTCELLDKIKEDYWEGFWDFTYKHRFGVANPNFNLELVKKAISKVKVEIPPILKQLEDDFRTIIKVDAN